MRAPLSTDEQKTKELSTPTVVGCIIDPWLLVHFSQRKGGLQSNPSWDLQCEMELGSQGSTRQP